MKLIFFYAFSVLILLKANCFGQIQFQNCFENDPYTQAYFDNFNYKFVSEARIKKIRTELLNSNLLGVKTFNQHGELTSEQEYKKNNNHYFKTFEINFTTNEQLPTIVSEIKYFKGDTIGNSKSNYYNFSEIMLLSNCLWERKIIQTSIFLRDSIVINKKSVYKNNLLQETKFYFDSIEISDIFYETDSDKLHKELPDIYQIGLYEYEQLNKKNNETNRLIYRFFLSFDRTQFIDVTYYLNKKGLIIDRAIENSPNSILNTHYEYEYFE